MRDFQGVSSFSTPPSPVKISNFPPKPLPPGLVAGNRPVRIGFLSIISFPTRCRTQRPMRSSFRAGTPGSKSSPRLPRSWMERFLAAITGGIYLISFLSSRSIIPNPGTLPRMRSGIRPGSDSSR